MAMTKRLYAAIEKTEELDDGTIKVWGYASAPTVDSDGETITADAMKAALPDYMKFGAVRDMHQPNAIGTAIEASVEADGRTFFGAHVVDPVAVIKVRNSVFKGFSIGGRVTSRDAVEKATITGLKLIEVSLVDRPANPDAVFTMYKAETEMTAVETLAKMVNDGDVTPEQLVELVKASQVAPVEPEPVADAVIDVPAPDVAEKADDAVEAATDADAAVVEPVEKGMGHVADLAYTLRCVAYMVADQQDEAEREGDASPVPASLKAWLATGLGILNAMTAEETAELLAAVPALDNGVPDLIAMADSVTDLEKAGARNSKTDKHTIQSMHDGACALGADCGTDKAETIDIAKVADDLAKALTAATDPLNKRIAELEALPAPAKAVLKLVGKGDDVIDTSKADAELDTTGMTPDQIAFAQIKKLHAMGGKPLA